MNKQLVSIRITRLPGRRGDGDDGGVALDAWEAIVASDPDLIPMDYVTGRNPRTGSVVSVSLKGGACHRTIDGDAVMPFWWEHGEIVCHAASPATVEKARTIAQALGAQCVASSVAENGKGGN